MIKDAKAITARVFHRVHGGISIAEEVFGSAAILRKNRDADTESHVDFPAADLYGLGGIANNLVAAALNVLYGTEFGHHNDELVSTHPRDGVGFANGGEQALSYSRQEEIAVGVTERVVDLLEMVDVNEEYRNLLVVVLCLKDCLAETLIEQRAIGETGQMIVMRKIVDVIGAAAVFGNVAAGNGDSTAQPDNLNVEPGSLDHLVVDEDLTGVRNSGADNLTILVNEAGFDHEGPDFGEDFAVKGLAGYAEPTCGIGVDIAESEVNDGAGRIGDPIEDVEIVKRALRSSQEPRVICRHGRVYLSMPSRRGYFEKSEALAPETFREHMQSPVDSGK